VKVWELPPTEAHWRELAPMATDIEEPANPNFGKVRTPTDDRDPEKHELVYIKHNFAEVFNVPKFSAVKDEYKYTARKKTKRYNTDGTPKVKKVIREKGTLDPEFLKSNKLTSDT